MKTRIVIINVCSFVAIIALTVCLASGFLAYFETVSMDDYKTILDLATVVWFITSPFWMVPQLFGKAFAEAGKSALLTPKKKS